MQNKIYLAVLVRVISGLNIELAAKLLQNVVLCQWTFELIVAFQEDRAVINTGHVFKKAGIKHKQLELIQLIKSGKRMLHLGDIVDTVQHTGRNKPFNRFFKITRSSAFPDSPIHELLIGFGKLCNDAAKDHENAPAVDLAIVLGKVVFINLDQLFLDLRNTRRIFVFHPRGNAFRHSSDNQVIVVGIQQATVKDLLNLLTFLDAFIIGEKRGIGCVQKLIEA